MRFYTNSHKYSCGIDLHAKNMYLCVINDVGRKLFHKNIRTNGDELLKCLEPYREDVAVATECVFNWYWVADLCRANNIPFVLGHALYMKAIHGGKAKNDKIDSEKIARLLSAKMLPQAYVYPREMRSARDLMRRRTHFTRKRASLVAHLQMCRIQYNLEDFDGSPKYKKYREGVVSHFDDIFVRQSVSANLSAIERYDDIIRDLEREILRAAKVHDSQAFYLLNTIPGIGEILALTILYEIHTISRFPRVQDFLSYCRLVKSSKESGGKLYGTQGAKIGNVHLKWAFSEASILILRNSDEATAFVQKITKKHGKGKALGILAAKLGRAAYCMLSKGRSFDMKKFMR